jgi:hypothetical protein
VFLFLSGLLAETQGSATFWGFMTASAVAGGSLYKLVEFFISKGNKQLEMEAQSREREDVREAHEIERLWSLVTKLQEEMGALKAEVEKVRIEKHAAVNQLAAVSGQRDLAAQDAERWKKAAHYWWGAASKAAEFVGPEKAKELGLIKKAR